MGRPSIKKIQRKKDQQLYDMLKKVQGMRMVADHMHERMGDLEDSYNKMGLDVSYCKGYGQACIDCVGFITETMQDIHNDILNDRL